MIYTVTFNPSLDYIVTVKDFKLGEVNRTSEEVVFPGGKGINVSIVLNNLGMNNVALGFVSGFTGEALERLIKDKGVTTDFIHLNKGLTRINVKLRSNEESEINGKGPEISDEAATELYNKLNDLQDGDYLVLAGSIPDSLPQSLYMDIMKRFQDKKLNIVVDATKDLLTNVLEYKPFLIKPNNHELGEIFGVKINDRKTAGIYAKKLQEKGAKNVLVSMAGEGAVLVTETGEVFETEAPKGKKVNSVGAGDSMVAGFITGYIEKEDYAFALQMGVCTGSASAFSEELATREEVVKLLKGGNCQ